MKCSKCGYESEGAVKFCPECGSRMPGATELSAQSYAEGVSMGAMRTLPEAPAGEPGGGAADVSLGGLRTMAGPSGRPGGGSAVVSEAVEARYELLEEIGCGGFASVWKARDKKLGRMVALKRLMPDALSDSGGDQTLARFRREAEAIARMNHRNIVSVYDRGEDAKGPYIVMELVEGGSLRGYVREHGGKLPVEEAVRLVKGVAQGLSFAHRNNLVHRDVKPANVLLHRDPTAKAEADRFVPKLVDFGLARAGGESDLSMSGYGMGTPYYMPPEQRRDAKSVNHTADIYALGKTLYELVSGEVPDNVDPSKIPPVAGLSEVIFNCVKSNPSERFFSADELLEALDKVGPKGAAKPIPGAGTVTAGGNPCPSCGAPNAVDAKFCESCGAGMTRVCPECGRENSVNKRFCPGCGTEGEAFLKWEETLQTMRRYRDAKRWSRVVKEHGQRSVDVKLPGKKGQAMEAEARALLDEARGNAAKIDELAVRIGSFGNWDQIDRSLEDVWTLSDLDPEREGLDKAQSMLEKLFETEDERKLRLRSADFEGALHVLESMRQWGLSAEAAQNAATEIGDEKRDYDDGLAAVARLADGGRIDEAAARLREMRARWPESRSLSAIGDRIEPVHRSLSVEKLGQTDQSRTVAAQKPLSNQVQTVADGDSVLADQRMRFLVALRCRLGHGDQGGARVNASEIHNAGDVQIVGLGHDVKLELVWCPPGTFIMGSPERKTEGWLWGKVVQKGESGRNTDETQHAVTLTKGFWMGKYEVTQRQWEAVMGSNPSHFKNAGPDAPVENVSWNDCQAFIRKVNAQVPGGGFRLPTEAEWEHACRAGTTTAFHYGNDLDASMANFDGNYPYGNGMKGEDRQKPLSVGSFRPNAWGLHDMHGNVWEWCADWYGDYPSGSATDPSGPGSGTNRVDRGGCWSDDAGLCRSAFRFRDVPGRSSSGLGLRLARTFDDP